MVFFFCLFFFFIGSSGHIERKRGEETKTFAGRARATA